ATKNTQAFPPSPFIKSMRCTLGLTTICAKSISERRLVISAKAGYPGFEISGFRVALPPEADQPEAEAIASLRGMTPELLNPFVSILSPVAARAKPFPA